jgi:hypothetical protein
MWEASLTGGKSLPRETKWSKIHLLTLAASAGVNYAEGNDTNLNLFFSTLN